MHPVPGRAGAGGVGITTDGKPVFVALDRGRPRVHRRVGDFLDGLRSRGLRPPLLVISDGAAGLINAAETALARSLRQKCLIHRARNVLAKVPATAQDEVRDAYWAIFDTDALTAAGIEPGHKLVPRCRAASTPSPRPTASSTPSAVKCLLTDREQLTSYLRFPIEHHKRIRHSNFIERTFGETRRRVKVIGRLLGETSCLNLVWAVLDRASRGWRGVKPPTPGCACCTTCAVSSSTRQPPSAEPATLPQNPKKLSAPSPNIPTEGAQIHVIYTAPGTPPPQVVAYMADADRRRQTHSGIRSQPA